MDIESESSSCSKNSTERERASNLFNCNICWQLAKDPIVTQCGLLYCWPCLYRWLHFHTKFRGCPVCEAIIEEYKLVPLYGIGSEGKEAKDLDPNSQKSIPKRPAGPRPETATSPPAPRRRPRPMLRAAFAVTAQLVLILCFLILVFPILQRW
uniref:E3 ubiquitin-protein ligase RMA n=1 Tax=Quercus lobata TaxID=97700 RepID=A0A7N2R8G2_QUELO